MSPIYLSYWEQKPVNSNIKRFYNQKILDTLEVWNPDDVLGLILHVGSLSNGDLKFSPEPPLEEVQTKNQGSRGTYSTLTPDQGSQNADTVWHEVVKGSERAVTIYISKTEEDVFCQVMEEKN